MPQYPIPNVNDTRDLFTIFNFVQDASGGIFFPIMLLVIWVIIFIGSIAERREAYRAWIYASFACVILSVILSLMGFLDSKFIYLLALFTAVGALWAHLQRNKSL